jgi:hypothetical protein
MFDNSIPRPLKDFAAREFSGEKLVWAAQPDVRIAFWLSFGIWLFAIPWTAFSLFWESMVAGPLILDMLGYEVGGMKPTGNIGQGMMAVMSLFGLPFILIGFGMLLAPFWVLRKGTRTLYVLTNKRMAVLNGAKTVSVVSVWPSDIVSLSRKEGPDGRGTLILHQGFMRDSDGDRQEKTTEFGVINDVRRIEQLVLEMKNKATAV